MSVRGVNCADPHFPSFLENPQLCMTDCLMLMYTLHCITLCTPYSPGTPRVYGRSWRTFASVALLIPMIVDYTRNGVTGCHSAGREGVIKGNVSP